MENSQETKVSGTLKFFSTATLIFLVIEIILFVLGNREMVQQPGPTYGLGYGLVLLAVSPLLILSSIVTLILSFKKKTNYTKLFASLAIISLLVLFGLLTNAFGFGY